MPAPNPQQLPLDSQPAPSVCTLRPCPRCRATGKLVRDDHTLALIECPTCAGTGQYNTNDIPF